MAAFDQMPDGSHGAGVVVGGQRRNMGAGNVANDQHNRHAARNEWRKIGRFRAARRRDNQPGNAVFAHRGHHFALPLDLFTRVGEKLNEAGRLHDGIDADRQFRKEAVGQIVDDDADDLGLRLAKIGGAAVIDIAEIADGGIYLGARRLVDQRTALENERHGRLRHAGGARNIDDRYPLLDHSILPNFLARFSLS